MKKGPIKAYQEDIIPGDFKKQPIEKGFKVEELDVFPNRLICYIKMKIPSVDKQRNSIDELNIKGTGCLISPKYILTAAHNLIGKQMKIADFKNIKQDFKDESYIQQGLGLGEAQQNRKYICRLGIKSQFINPKYQSVMKNKQKEYLEDYALIEIDPKSPGFKEDQFMPIVYLSSEAMNQITSVSVYGYAIEYNRLNCSQKDKSSVYMHLLSGGSGDIKKHGKNYLSYQCPAQKGTSGAPIIAEYRGEKVIIGIHKAIQGNTQQERENMGVSAGQMLEVFNNFGYEHQKRPFVFTDKTLGLREKQVSDRQILFLSIICLILVDKSFQFYDMLVLTAYDLTKVKKMILSGNLIGNQGVEILLRRKYPNMASLFLTQNRINNLDNIPEENWNNISNLVTLGLNVNQLTTVPTGFLRLKKVQKLWLAHNRFKTMPQVLYRYCKQNDKESLAVYLYENSINFEDQKDRIAELSKGNARVIWSREGEEKLIKTAPKAQ